MPADKKHTRRKVRVEANRMENARVEWISLVERGANRQPFKILKSAKGEVIDQDALRDLVQKVCEIEDAELRRKAAVQVISEVFYPDSKLRAVTPTLSKADQEFARQDMRNSLGFNSPRMRRP